jgi:chromosome segregation ATPase
MPILGIEVIWSVANAVPCGGDEDRVTELEDKLKQAEDEKSEILEKVDSLQDALRDKEQVATEELERLEKLKEELSNASATQEQYEKENQIMVGRIAELTVQMERLQCERAESQVVIESLSEQKETLQAELLRLQSEFAELQEAHKRLTTTHKKVALQPTPELRSSPDRHHTLVLLGRQRARARVSGGNTPK